MISFKFKKLLGALGLMVVTIHAYAELITDKTVINTISGAATVSVSVAKPVTGDLYLATPLNGRLHFFADNGTKLVTTVLPFTANASFAGDRVLMKIAREGIPPDEYSLFQVITAPGKDPLDGNNWLGGLSELKFRINLPDEVYTPFSPTVATVPTPEPTIPDTSFSPEPTSVPTSTPTSSPDADNCTAEKEDISGKESDADDEKNEKETGNCSSTPTPTPTPTPVSLDGKGLYNNNCSSSGCHGTNAKANRYNVLKGKNPDSVRDAINKNKGNMGLLKNITDADLQAIADYFKTL
ncbi:MAG: c-type cytochrome [Methylococcales bacterium]